MLAYVDGPADAVLFERLHEARLGVARRRLGEMLLGPDRQQLQLIADLHRRQDAIVVVVARIVESFLIYGDVAGLHERRAVRAQHGGCSRRAWQPCPGTRSTATVSYTAGSIWLATARFQIRLYSFS